MQIKAVNKFQGIFSLVLLAAAGLLALSHLDGLVFEERPVRARAQAMELAQAVLDYRGDTGSWPLNPDGDPDLTPLLGRRADQRAASLAGGTGPGANSFGGIDQSVSHLVTEKTWLREIPLDPWGRPYRLLVTPKAVAIISSGPNRVQDTNLVRVWMRPDNINRGDGDDICIVLETHLIGESR